MAFDVWHTARPTYSDADERTLERFPEGFVRVATVVAASPDDAFFATTHRGDEDWTKGDTVVLIYPPGSAKRSTSVGDVVTSGERKWTLTILGWRAF